MQQATSDPYWSLGVRDFERNHTRFMAEIQKMHPIRRAQLLSLMGSKVGEQFLLAPASTRKQYHNAFPAGLLAHSLTVLDFTHSLAEAIHPARWDDAKLAFCALFHDIGKAGTAGQPYYVEIREQWKRERGEYYEVCQDDWMPTSEKGLFVLQQAGITLDHEEYMAIRLNDGMTPVENKPYSFKEPDLAVLIHQADLWATLREKAAAAGF